MGHLGKSGVDHKSVDFETRNPIFSQREFAKDTEVPRTTLQHWLKRKDQIGVNPELVDFLDLCG